MTKNSVAVTVKLNKIYGEWWRFIYATWDWIKLCNLLSTIISRSRLLSNLVYSDSSKHSIDPELIRGVEIRMRQYTRIQPPMEIKGGGDNVSYDTAQGSLLLIVLVHDANNIYRKVKLPVVLVPGLKNVFFKRSSCTKMYQNCNSKEPVTPRPWTMLCSVN